jgi:flagellar basal-body rod protein FlgF
MNTELVAALGALWVRHELLANNLANASTTGFKRDDLLWPAPEPAGPVPTAVGWWPAPGLLRAPEAWTDFSQGALRSTGRELDLALEGPGFFVVDTPAGPRYTRAGAFVLTADGRLSTPDGLAVLGEAGPLTLRSPRPVVTAEGEIREGSAAVGRLRIVEFPPETRLLKVGGTLFVPEREEVAPLPARATRVAQGALEAANVNPVQEMVGLISVLRAWEAYHRALQAMDETAREATQELGRV